jgi:cytochrome c5
MASFQFNKFVTMSALFFALMFMIVSSQAEDKNGKDVYMKWCDGCHMDSPFAPGTILLRKIRGDDLALILERKDLSADYINHLVRKGMNGMPLFRRTEISNEELHALIEFLVRDK